MQQICGNFKAGRDRYRVGNYATSRFKERVRAAFFYRCEYCGAEQPPNAKPNQLLNVDRIIPGSAGGKYLPDNVTCACRRCNSAKRDRSGFRGARTLAEMESGEPRPRIVRDILVLIDRRAS